MPIRGLERAPRLPLVGVLRKGGQREADNRPGRDLGKVFRFVSPDEVIQRRFEAHYGGAPEQIEVTAAGATVDEAFQFWQEEWGQSGLHHRCDGERCVVVRDKVSGALVRFEEEDAKAPLCPGGCRKVGRLSLIVPALRTLGMVTLITSSVHDIVNIQQCLGAFAALQQDSLWRVPLVLSRQLREISVPGRDGKRMRSKKYLVHLAVDPQWVETKLSLLRGVVTALPAPAEDVAPTAIQPDVDEDDEGDGGDEAGENVPKATGDPQQPTPTPALAIGRDAASKLYQVMRNRGITPAEIAKIVAGVAPGLEPSGMPLLTGEQAGRILRITNYEGDERAAWGGRS